MLWLAPGMRGLAVCAGATVLAYAVDVIAGSHLTELSLIGPNPIEGVRFYGIGNELEATVAALVPIGAGAALAGWAPRASGRAAAVAFAITAVLAVAAFRARKLWGRRRRGDWDPDRGGGLDRYLPRSPAQRLGLGDRRAARGRCRY